LKNFNHNTKQSWRPIVWRIIHNNRNILTIQINVTRKIKNKHLILKSTIAHCAWNLIVISIFIIFMIMIISSDKHIGYYYKWESWCANKLRKYGSGLGKRNGENPKTPFYSHITKRKWMGFWEWHYSKSIKRIY